jgi:hypothetical protein
MSRYKVIDPAGLLVDGKLKSPGDLITAGPGAMLNAWLHFRQIEAAPEEAPALTADEQAALDLAAEAEAAAKAKEEADKAAAAKASK